VKAISGVDLTPVQVDVIYHVLDKYERPTQASSPAGVSLTIARLCGGGGYVQHRDGNGKLDHNELMEVMSKRCALRLVQRLCGVFTED
jgi:hypothetical protein